MEAEEEEAYTVPFSTAVPASTSDANRPRQAAAHVPLVEIVDKPQTSQQVLAAPVPSRGYQNNPARLSTSKRLSEIIGPSLSNQFTSTPTALGRSGPNLARQVPRQFQHHIHQGTRITHPSVPIHGMISSENEPFQPLPTETSPRIVQPQDLETQRDRTIPIIATCHSQSSSRQERSCH